jgi:hypothetical protein
MRCGYLLVLFLWVLSARGQEVHGGRAAALGAASVCLRDPWSGWHNPAALAGAERAWLAGSYTSRYGLPELGRQALGLLWPSGRSGLGLQLSRGGSSSFRELNAGLGYGRSLGPRLALGLDAHYYSLAIPGYGQRRVLTGGLGIRYEPAEGWALGARVFNPFRVRLQPESGGQSPGELPVALSAGLSHQLSRELLLAVQADQSLNNGLQMRGGLEYSPMDPLRLRVGFSTLPASFHAGLGLQSGRWMGDLALSHHPFLGYSATLGLAWAMGPPGKEPRDGPKIVSQP